MTTSRKEMKELRDQYREMLKQGSLKDVSILALVNCTPATLGDAAIAAGTVVGASAVAAVVAGSYPLQQLLGLLHGSLRTSLQAIEVLL